MFYNLFVTYLEVLKAVPVKYGWIDEPLQSFTSFPFFSWFLPYFNFSIPKLSGARFPHLGLKAVDASTPSVASAQAQVAHTRTSGTSGTRQFKTIIKDHQRKHVKETCKKTCSNIPRHWKVTFCSTHCHVASCSKSHLTICELRSPAPATMTIKYSRESKNPSKAWDATLGTSWDTKESLFWFVCSGCWCLGSVMCSERRREDSRHQNCSTLNCCQLGRPARLKVWICECTLDAVNEDDRPSIQQNLFYLVLIIADFRHLYICW